MDAIVLGSVDNDSQIKVQFFAIHAKFCLSQSDFIRQKIKRENIKTHTDGQTDGQTDTHTLPNCSGTGKVFTKKEKVKQSFSKLWDVSS